MFSKTDVDQIVTIAKSAGEKLKQWSSEGFHVNSKNTRTDLVTDVDYMIQEYLIKEISQSFKNSAFLAEESGYEHIPKEQSYWVIDPIDGTVNFSRGIPENCISIAYVENSAPVVILQSRRLGYLYKGERGNLTVNHQRLFPKILQGGFENMRSLKKLLAVLLALTMVLSIMVVPTFAAESFMYEDEAQKLYEMGLFKGKSTTEFVPDLESRLERQDGVALLLRLFCLDKEAEKLSESEAKAILAEKFSDADEVAAWAVKYVAYAVKEGIIQGRPDGKFAPKDPLLGKEFATMILRRLGYTVDENNFQTAAAELAAVSEFPASEAIRLNNEILIRDDVVGMSYFTLTAQYTDGSTVISKLIAENPELKAKAIEFGLIAIAKINSVFEPITIKVGESVEYPAKVEIEYTDGSTEEVSVVWDKSEVKTDVAGEYKAYGSVEGFDGKVELAIVVKEEVLKVESVTADNLKEIVVVFNKAVDKESAETGSNYVLSPNNAGGTPTAKLKEDGKTVILTVPTKLQNQGDYKLTIEKVKDTDGKAIAKASYEFTAFDAQLPTVEDIVITGPKTFDIIFSEPIEKTGTVTVKSANTTLSVQSANANNSNKVSVTLYTNLADGTEYEITVKDYEDFAGYKNIIKTITLPYTKDNTAPVATLEKATQQYVVIKFNKPVSGLAADNFYHTFTAWQALGIYKTEEDMNNNSNPIKTNEAVTTVYVKFATTGSQGEHPLQPGTVNIHILGKVGSREVKDNWGNKLPDTVLTAEIVADLEAPTVTKVEAPAKNQIKITFSKAISNLTTLSNYEILNSDGTKISGLTFTASPAADLKSVTLNLSSDMTGKTVVVNVKDITDNTLNKNKMTSTYSTTITFEDKEFAGVARVEFDNSVTHSVLYVIYKEAMNDTALVMDNYRLKDGDTIRKLAGPASFFGGNKVVKIELSPTEAGYIDVDSDELLIANVEDLAGNKSSEFQISVPIVGLGTPDSIPNLHSDGISAIGKNTVTVQFDQELVVVDPNEFALKIGQDGDYKRAVGVEITNNSKGSLVKLTFEDNIPANVANVYLMSTSAPGEITDRITPQRFTNTKNIFNVPPAQIPEGTSVKDKIAPTVAEYRYISPTRIVITFTEALNPDTLARAGTNGFSVAGGTLNSALLDAKDNTKVILTGKDFTVDTDVFYNGTHGIKDANGNALAAIEKTSALVFNGISLSSTVITEGTDDVGEVVEVTVTTDSVAAGNIVVNVTDGQNNYPVKVTIGADDDTAAEVAAKIAAALQTNENVAENFTVDYNNGENTITITAKTAGDINLKVELW